jgi:hypothetical protein
MRTTILASLAWPAAVILASLAASHSAIAQQEPATVKKQKGDALKLVTYEVGDLVVNVPDYSLVGEGGLSAMQSGGGGGGGFGGGGGGFGGGGGAPGVFVAPNVQAGSVGGDQQITIDGLSRAIVNTIAPDTWNEEANATGRIQALGSVLIVSQTAEVHNAIEVLLNELRRGSATRRTVSIDARWLLLDSDDLDRLVTTNDQGERTIDPKVLAEFTRHPTSLRGITNCFSGQSVYLISGTRRNVVSSFIPVVGSVELPESDMMFVSDSSKPRIVFTQFGGGNSGAQGGFGGRSVGYQPIIEKPNFGVTMEIRPTLVLDAKAAVIDLKSMVTFPGQEPATVEAAAAPGMPSVDRLAIQSQELATTLRVPLGEPVLVGGMTYLASSPEEGMPPGDASGQGPSGETSQLYLVVELR